MKNDPYLDRPLRSIEQAAYEKGVAGYNNGVDLFARIDIKDTTVRKWWCRGWRDAADFAEPLRVGEPDRRGPVAFVGVV